MFIFAFNTILIRLKISPGSSFQRSSTCFNISKQFCITVQLSPLYEDGFISTNSDDVMVW